MMWNPLEILASSGNQFLPFLTAAQHDPPARDRSVQAGAWTSASSSRALSPRACMGPCHIQPAYCTVEMPRVVRGFGPGSGPSCIRADVTTPMPDGVFARNALMVQNHSLSIRSCSDVLSCDAGCILRMDIGRRLRHGDRYPAHRYAWRLHWGYHSSATSNERCRRDERPRARMREGV